jgi:hypothetical protein
MLFFGQLLRRVHVRIAELLRCRSFPPVLSPFRVHGDTGLPSTIKMPKHTALPSCGCVHPRCQTRAVWLWLTGSAVHCPCPASSVPPTEGRFRTWCLAPSGTTNNAPACLLTQRRDLRGASGPAAAVAGHAVRAWRGGQATRAVTVGGLQKTRRLISVRRARSPQLTGKVGSTTGGLTNLNRLNG